MGAVVCSGAVGTTGFGESLLSTPETERRCGVWTAGIGVVMAPIVPTDRSRGCVEEIEGLGSMESEGITLKFKREGMERLRDR